MYGFGRNVSGTLQQAIDNVTEELKKEGFGVLVDIDVAATLKTKIGVDRRPYRILGACNPTLANKAIEAEPEIGLLLPCNVLVREQDDGVIHVSFMDPLSVLGLVDKKEIAGLGQEVRARLDRVCAALK